MAVYCFGISSKAKTRPGFLSQKYFKTLPALLEDPASLTPLLQYEGTFTACDSDFVLYSFYKTLYMEKFGSLKQCYLVTNRIQLCTHACGGKSYFYTYFSVPR